jgi:hypothetical protein
VQCLARAVRCLALPGTCQAPFQIDERLHPRGGHCVGEGGRVDRARHQGPWRAVMGGRALLQQVPHHAAADRLSGARRVPPDHQRLETRLRENVSRRLRLAARRGGQPKPPALWPRLDEVQDAVLVGGLARRDRAPQERLQLRLERSEVGARTRFDQSPQNGHPACCEQPADDEQAPRVPCGHPVILSEPKRSTGDPVGSPVPCLSTRLKRSLGRAP